MKNETAEYGNHKGDMKWGKEDLVKPFGCLQGPLPLTVHSS